MVVQTKEQIYLLLDQAQEKLTKFGVKRCGLFGSFLRGRQNLQSDIDLLVEFETGKKTYDNYIHLAFFLEELFGRPVDLVTPESLSPYIGPHILREVEYASDSTRVSATYSAPLQVVDILNISSEITKIEFSNC